MLFKQAGKSESFKTNGIKSGLQPSKEIPLNTSVGYLKLKQTYALVSVC